MEITQNPTAVRFKLRSNWTFPGAMGMSIRINSTPAIRRVSIRPIIKLRMSEVDDDDGFNSEGRIATSLLA